MKLKTKVGLEDVGIWTGIECWAQPINGYDLRSSNHSVVGVLSIDGVFDDDATVHAAGRLVGGHLQSYILFAKISIVAGQ